MEQGHMLPCRPEERPSTAMADSSLKTLAAQHAPQHAPVASANIDPQLRQLLEPSLPDAASLTYGHKSYPPPSYAQSHDELALPSFPDAPKTELPPIQSKSMGSAVANSSLPSLSSVTGPQPPLYGALRPAETSYSPPPSRATQWPSMNPLTTFYTPSHAQAADSPQRMDVDVSSSGTTSAASPDQFYDGRASSVSLDDPDVRMAAEALGDLRADFVSSPPKRHTPLPATSPRAFGENGPEPLLSLLTTSHPLIASTLDTANKAYTTSKKTYPRFKSSAEYLEGYLSPIANTVESVGRATGVNGGVRWFLGGGRRHGSSSSDLETGDRKSHKRRKMDSAASNSNLDALADKALSTPALPDVDLYGFTKDRRNSISTVDTLPAYDDFRSPAYNDTVEQQNQVSTRSNSTATGPWQQRLIMSTSGLSIAMSDESLRSLKYCLQWLRWANEHIAKVIAALRSTLRQYDGSSGAEGDEEMQATGEEMGRPMPALTGEDRRHLAVRIHELKKDVLKTLRDVIETVSKYAGGALPDNARELVHRHLTSLPQRFRIATMQDASAQAQGEGAGEHEMRDGAQRVLVLAKEGLDMMEQVSGVLDGTIISAEEWCERLGKKKKEGIESSDEKPAVPVLAEPLATVAVDTDMKTGY